MEENRMITYKQAIEPLEATCGKCGGTLWIMPYGLSLCSKCTFNEEGMTLAEMLQRVYAK